jgi:hypothetical protein
VRRWCQSRVKGRAEISLPSEVFEYKRSAYNHENEVRAMITRYPHRGIEDGTPVTSSPVPGEEISESGIFVAVDLASLIDQIVVTPYADAWFVDVVRGLSDKYGLPSGRVVESELRVDPVYATRSRT